MAIGNALSLGSMVVELGLKTDGFNTALGKANTSINSKLGNIKSAANTMAVGLGAAFTVGAVGIGVMVKAAADFEEGLSSVKAVSGATKDEMIGLKSLAQQIGRDTAFSATQAAGAMFELAKGGVSIQDTMNGAALATANLASAGGVTLSEAASVSANALNAFSIAGTELAGVVDKIAGLAVSTNTDVRGFAMAMQAGAAAAKATGLSFDDFALSVGAMADNAIVGSDAGTSLKTMLINLVPSSDTAIAAFKELGIVTADGTNKFIDAEGAVRPMTEIAGVLSDAVKDLTKSEQTYLLKMAFGTDAFRAAVALAGKGAEGMEELADKMNAVSAATIAAEKLNNLKGALTIFKGSAQTLAAQLGEVLLPILTKIVQVGTEFINWIGELPAGVRKAGVIFAVGGTFLAGLGAVAAAMVSLGIGVMPLVTAVTGISGVGGLLGAIGLVLTGPVGIIVGITALAAAFVAFNPRVREAVVGMFSGLVEPFKEIGSFLADYLPSWQTFAGVLGSVGKILMAGAESVIILAFKALVLPLKNIASVATEIIGWFEAVKGFFTHSAAVASGMAAFQAAWGGIKDGIAGFGGPDGHFQKFADAAGTVLTAAGPIIEKLPIMGPIWAAAREMVTGEGDSSLLSAIKKLPQLVVNALNAITGVLEKIPILGGIWTNTMDLIVGENGLVSAVQNIGGAIVDELGVGSSAQTEAGSLVTKFGSLQTALADSGHIGGMILSVKEFSQQLGDPKKAWSIAATTSELRKYFVEGPGYDDIQAIGDMWSDRGTPGSFASKSDDAGFAFLQGLEEALYGADGERTVEIGRTVTGMLADGLEQAKPTLAEAAEAHRLELKARYADWVGPSSPYMPAVDGLKDMFNAETGPALPAIKSGMDAFRNSILGIVDTGPDSITKGIDKIGGAAATAADAAAQAAARVRAGQDSSGAEIELVATPWWELADNAIQDTFRGVGEGSMLTAITQTMAVDVPAIFTGFINRFTDPSDPSSFLKIGEAWEGVFPAMKDSLRANVTGVLTQFAETLIKPIRDEITGLGTTFGNFVKDFVKDLVAARTGANTASNVAASALSNAGGSALGAAANAGGSAAGGAGVAALAGGGGAAAAAGGGAVAAGTGGAIPGIGATLGPTGGVGATGAGATPVIVTVGVAALAAVMLGLGVYLVFFRDAGYKEIRSLGTGWEQIPEDVRRRVHLQINPTGETLSVENKRRIVHTLVHKNGENKDISVTSTLPGGQGARMPITAELPTGEYVYYRSMVFKWTMTDLGRSFLDAGWVNRSDFRFNPAQWDYFDGFESGSHWLEKGEDGKTRVIVGTERAAEDRAAAAQKVQDDARALQNAGLASGNQTQNQRNTGIGVLKSELSGGFTSALQGLSIFSREDTDGFNLFDDDNVDRIAFGVTSGSAFSNLSQLAGRAGIGLSDVFISGNGGNRSVDDLMRSASGTEDQRREVRVFLSVDNLFATEDSYQGLATRLAEIIQQENILPA